MQNLQMQADTGRCVRDSDTANGITTEVVSF